MLAPSERNLLRNYLTNEPLPTTRRDQHPAAVYLARLAPGSRRTMRGALDTIARLISSGQHDAETLPWASLRYQHTTAIRTALMERYSPAGANLRLAALRGVLKECWRLGHLPSEDYHRAVDLEKVRGETLPKGRALSTGEMRELFCVCAADHSPAGRRDAAMIAVLCGCGLRRSEAISLDVGDYIPETGELQVLHGKGMKARAVYVPNGATGAIDAWLSVRGQGEGPLFFAVDKGGTIRKRRLTDKAVTIILVKRAGEAEIKTFSPHDLRRTFISTLLDRGADLSSVRRFAGHSQIETTARYDRRDEEAKKKASGLLHVPFVPERRR